MTRTAKKMNCRTQPASCEGCRSERLRADAKVMVEVDEGAGVDAGGALDMVVTNVEHPEQTFGWPATWEQRRQKGLPCHLTALLTASDGNGS